MKELKELTDVIRNLYHARAFIAASEQPSKEKTAEALESSIRKAMDTAHGLQYSLIHSNADEGTIMSSEESDVLVKYLAVRRDVEALLDADKKTEEADSADVKATQADEANAAQPAVPEEV